MNKINNLEKFILPAGLFLVFTFLLIAVIALSSLTISELITPLFNISKALLSDEVSKINWLNFLLTLLRIITLFAAVYLMSIIISILSTISSFVISVFQQDNDYEIIDTVFRGLSWNLYRIYYIFRPVLIVAAIGMTLILPFIAFFNFFLGIISVNITISIFISSFISLALIFGFLIAAFVSIWNAVTTLFGMDCIIEEPELSNKTVKKRAERLLFAHGKNWKIVPFYSIFVFLIATQIAFMLITGNFLNEDKLTIIVSVVSIDIVIFFGLNYLKFRLYQDSINEQFKRIIIDRVKYSNS